MQTNIIVKLQVEGTHNWPDATDGAGAEMHYLEYRHRHMFHIVAKKEVMHDDRDVEFIMFKRKINRYLREMYYTSELDLCDFGSQSCEMIADDLATVIQNKYPGRWLKISVAEDDENGCEIEYPVNYMPGGE